MILEILEDIYDEALDIIDDARHDWYFARRQMNTIQGPSLYKEDD